MNLVPTNFSYPIILANGVQYLVPLLRANSTTAIENDGHLFILLDLTALLAINVSYDGAKGEEEARQEIANTPSQARHPEYIGEPRHPAFLLELGLILFGIVCNSLTALVIAGSKLIRTNANKYIFTILLADTLYLLCAFADLVLHIRTINFPLCALDEWLNHCAVYVSAICIFMLTMERFVAIVCPMEHLQIADWNRWSMIALSIIPFLSFQSLIFFLILKLKHPNGPATDNTALFKCTFQMEMPWKGLDILLDNLLQFMLPLFVVTFLNSAIAFKVRHSADMKFLTGAIVQQQSAAPIELGNNVPSSIETTTANGGQTSAGIGITTNKNKRGRGGQTNGAARRKPFSVPLVLFIIPVVYTLLNTPFYAVRFLQLVMREFEGTTVDFPTLEPIAYLIFIANFASNAIFYAIASSTFRQQMASIWSSHAKNFSSVSSSTGANTTRLSSSDDGRIATANSDV